MDRSVVDIESGDFSLVLLAGLIASRIFLAGATLPASSWTSLRWSA